MESSLRLLLTATVPETFFYFYDQILPAIKNKGYTILIVSSYDSLISLDLVQKKYDVQVKTVRLKRTWSFIEDFIALIQMCKIINAFKPHILHTSTPKASIISLISGWIFHIPYRIYTIRGLVYCNKKKILSKIILRFCDQICCILANQVLAVSKSNMQYLISKNICNKNKIKILGNGSSHGVAAENIFNPHAINKADYCHIKNVLLIKETDTVFGFVGRLVYDKGIDELIQAWNILSSEIENIILLLVGPLSDCRDTISKALMDIINSSPNIRLTGPVINTLVYYSVMHIFVFPSHREGFPNSVLEASSMCLPVITTDALGCVDSIMHGQNGLIYPTGDFKALYASMLELYKNKEKRVEMGIKGREYAKHYYNPKRISHELLQVYENSRKKVIN